VRSQSAAAPDASSALDCGAPAPGWPCTLSWFALAALGSYALVALTNHLTQNIPSFPMMWVLPLVIYLLSFTLCFDGDRWYLPRVFRAATLLALLAMCALLWQERRVLNIGWHIGVFLAGLFIVCMYCHGELGAQPAASSRLTPSGGGAGGVVGALVAFGAPALLHGYFEVEIGFVLRLSRCYGAHGGWVWPGPVRRCWCWRPRQRPAYGACRKRWLPSSRSTAISTAWYGCANTAPISPASASAS
jgi:hypothetical protein